MAQQSGQPGAGLQEQLMKRLPPGTLQGLEEITSAEFWMAFMKQSEIEISNEDLFKYRFSDIGGDLETRLAFLAGSGDFTSFNAKYLINNIVEQCAEMQRYTKKLEKYCVKLQEKLTQQAAQQKQQQQQLAQAQAQHVALTSENKKRERSPSHDGDGDDSSARL